MHVSRPKIIQVKLWNITKQNPFKIKIKIRTLELIRHIQRKLACTIEKEAFVWNPQGTQKSGRHEKVNVEAWLPMEEGSKMTGQINNNNNKKKKKKKDDDDDDL